MIDLLKAIEAKLQSEKESNTNESNTNESDGKMVYSIKFEYDKTKEECTKLVSDIDITDLHSSDVIKALAISVAKDIEKIVKDKDITADSLALFLKEFMDISEDIA
jgi:hypothetical protein